MALLKTEKKKILFMCTCVMEDNAPTLLSTFLQDSNTASDGRNCGQKCRGVIFQDTWRVFTSQLLLI